MLIWLVYEDCVLSYYSVDLVDRDLEDLTSSWSVWPTINRGSPQSLRTSTGNFMKKVRSVLDIGRPFFFFLSLWPSGCHCSCAFLLGLFFVLMFVPSSCSCCWVNMFGRCVNCVFMVVLFFSYPSFVYNVAVGAANVEFFFFFYNVWNFIVSEKKCLLF